MIFFKSKKHPEIEEFINNYNDYLVREQILPDKDDVVYFFSMGCCYAYGKLLKSVFPKAKIMIDSSKKHCAVKYGGSIYDVRGKVKYPNYFNKATKKDLKYMDDFFGFSNYGKEHQDIFVEQTSKGFKENINPGIYLTITKPEEFSRKESNLAIA